MAKTARIIIEHKDPDGWNALAADLGLTAEQRDMFFEHGEYATLEIEIDDSLNIVGGRVLPSEDC